MQADVTFCEADCFLRNGLSRKCSFSGNRESPILKAYQISSCDNPRLGDSEFRNEAEDCLQDKQGSLEVY